MSIASLVAESEPELTATAQALCHVVFGLSKDWYALDTCAPISAAQTYNFAYRLLISCSWVSFGRLLKAMQSSDQ